jgi:hypothetical protein
LRGLFAAMQRPPTLLVRVDEVIVEVRFAAVRKFGSGTNRNRRDVTLPGTFVSLYRLFWTGKRV